MNKSSIWHLEQNSQEFPIGGVIKHWSLSKTQSFRLKLKIVLKFFKREKNLEMPGILAAKWNHFCLCAKVGGVYRAVANAAGIPVDGAES